MDTSSLKQLIWHTVASVPAGKVASYGQIARLTGYPGHARYVGTCLKNLPKDSRLPWHRIINGKGEIAFPMESPGFRRQRALLEAEGVAVTGCKVNMKNFQWQR